MGHDPIAARLGALRAEALGAELAAHGLEVIETSHRERLEREAGAYRRLAALVEPGAADEDGPHRPAGD